MKAAVISDVHGNSPALRAVLDDIRSHGIDELICLGDVVNGPDPRGSLELLLEWPAARCIKGNADMYLCVERLEEFPWQDRPPWHWLVPTLTEWREAIGPELLAQVAAWPDELVVDDAWMVHDTPLELMAAGTAAADLPEGYRLLTYHANGLVPRSPPHVYAANAAAVRTRGLRQLFFGHTHMPFVREEGGVTFCNAGSAGMPLDGDPRASWISWGEAGLGIRRVAYDIAAALELTARNVKDPERRKNYERMFPTGRHWRYA